MENSVVFNNAVIKKNAHVAYVILDEDVVVGENAKVGEVDATTKEITVIGRGYEVEANKVIGKALNIEKEVK